MNVTADGETVHVLLWTHRWCLRMHPDFRFDYWPALSVRRHSPCCELIADAQSGEKCIHTDVARGERAECKMPLTRRRRRPWRRPRRHRRDRHRRRRRRRRRNRRRRNWRDVGPEVAMLSCFLTLVNRLIDCCQLQSIVDAIRHAARQAHCQSNSVCCHIPNISTWVRHRRNGPVNVKPLQASL